MENHNEFGCVYFFKHVGLTPIKIGYSQNESPFNRFEQFKTYAPFGAELIGFIRTKTAKELETLLHQKFSRDRLKGEWFEISKDEAEKCIKFHSDLEHIEELNSFQIAWAKTFVKNLPDEKNIEETAVNFYKNFSLTNDKNTEIVYLNQREISLIINSERSEIAKFLSKNGISQKTRRINGFLKNSYKLFRKL
jgi:hypothetical protein